jgi:tRNA A37 methylthiotransferase MiaB
MRGQVRGDIKRERARRLRELDAQMRSDYLELNFGRELQVLGERYEDGLLTGKSENYLTVFYPGRQDDINNFYDIEIKGSFENGLYGERAGRN